MSIDRLLLRTKQFKDTLVERLGFRKAISTARGIYHTPTTLKWTACATLAAVAIGLGGNNLRAATLYVDDDATGLNNGSSWVNSYNSLQDALAVAKPNDIVKIAQGVYTPDFGGGNVRYDRGASFYLKNGVTIEGGYAGLSGQDPNDRDIELYKTILSGDLNVNDTKVTYAWNMWGDTTRNDNSYHVITCLQNETAVLDGFTITGGNANGPEQPNNDDSLKHGAAMYIWESSPTIENCIIERSSGWSAVYIYQSNPNFSNCNVTYGLGLGGAVHNINSNTQLINCILSNNHGEYGGAIGSVNSNLTLIKCNVKHNMADFGAGAYISNSGSDSQLYAENCNILSNFAPQGGGIFLDNSSSEGNFKNDFGLYDNGTNRYKVILINCAFIHNSAIIGGGILNIGNSSEVKNSIIHSNTLEQITDATDQANFTYCCIQGGYPGEGNIDKDPLFVLRGYSDDNGTPSNRHDDFWVDGDYHLLSEAGRYDPVASTWIIDGITSPCIDSGDPNSPIGDEPEPNGGRVNMGFYGGTEQASKSPQKAVNSP